MIRRSVFIKLLLVFLGTMILTALLSGVFGSRLYRGYFIQERQASMLEQGRDIAKLISAQHWSEHDLRSVLKLVATSRTLVYVYGRNGDLLAQAPPKTSGLSQSEEDVVADTLTGQEQIRSLGDNSSKEALEIGIPLHKDGQVTGALVIKSLGLERHFGGVYHVLLNSGLTAVLVCSVVAFLFSRSIARPLQEMSTVVRKMAKGDFSTKVKVRSQDEVGELASAFNQMAEELSTLESMRREFVAHASHELRSPLTSIRGFVQAILDGTIPLQEQRPFLERIHRESERLGHLVDDLLELSELEAETEPPGSEAGTCNLSLVVQEAVQTLSPLYQEQNIRLTCTVSEDLIVSSQAERLLQVVINLLSNAIRFTATGGEIDIRAFANEGMGRVEITDNGIGIPEGEIERVFERFYKVDKARSLGGGTGLGLPIAKRIVESYHGQIGLNSEWEKGTCAWFEVPLGGAETP